MVVQGAGSRQEADMRAQEKGKILTRSSPTQKGNLFQNTTGKGISNKSGLLDTWMSATLEKKNWSGKRPTANDKDKRKKNNKVCYNGILSMLPIATNKKKKKSLLLSD